MRDFDLWRYVAPLPVRLITSALARLGEARDELSSRIARLLDGAWFHGQAASASEVQALIEEARDIIKRAEDLATAP